MKPTKTAQELLDMYFLHMRSALIETAASFDRIQFAEGSDAIWTHSQLEELREAARILTGDEGNKAARILHVLSVPEEEA